MADSYHDHKRYQMLNLIHHLGPISRTQLTAVADYRPASVGEITKELLEESLIVESGKFSSSHGRKRSMLEINKNQLYAIGLSFSGDVVSYLVAQIDGHVLQSGVVQSDGTRESLTDRIVEQVRQLLQQHSGQQLVGIGICDPFYDPSGYQIADSLLSSYAHFNDWVHMGVKPRLEEIAGAPVETFSSVTLPALAEQRFGVAKGVRDFICVELSNGIGASICCGGNVVAGASGVAGELGHTVIDFKKPQKTLCYCGKPGCVEGETAFPALAKEIGGALKRGVFSVLNSFYDGSRPLTVQDIYRALAAGDQMCMYYVKEMAEKLGVAIANAINLLNPEMVVLHGFLLELGDYFLLQLQNAIRENVLSLSGGFEIRISESLQSNLTLGAVAEMFSGYLKMDNYRWIYAIKKDYLEGEPEL